MGRIYRPRWAAELVVPLFGSTAEKQAAIKDSGAIRIPVRVRRFELEANDHNHADTLKLDAEWRDIGADPRQLSSARVQFYVANADEYGHWTPTRDNLRFVGILRHGSRGGGGGRGMHVSLDFVDYTSFFLNQKPFPAEGIPALTDTLADAWKKICAHVGYYDVSQQKIVSSVDDLSEALVFQGGTDSTTQIGKAVTERFRKLGKVQVQVGADAWAVWNQCCGMLGLITYFKLDKVIVTTATDYYTLNNPPRLVWGSNILEWNEDVGSHRAHKGVCIQCYNPLTNTQIEAFYPLPGDPRIRQKRTPGKKINAAADSIQSEQYEPFAVPGITDQGVADKIARRAYEEYARQQAEGTLTTREMSCDTVSGTTFDLMRLGAGDAVQLEFTTDEIFEVAQRTTLDARINYLIGRGYAQPVAELMAKNFDAFKDLAPVFHAKNVRTTGESTEDGGSFEVSINYANVIDIMGSTIDPPQALKNPSSPSDSRAANHDGGTGPTADKN